jgi:hypothetical protein
VKYYYEGLSLKRQEFLSPSQGALLHALDALSLGKRPPVPTEQEEDSPTTGLNMVAEKNPNFIRNQIQIIQYTDTHFTGQGIEGPA